MNNKVQNPKIELDSSIEMNDENYLMKYMKCLNKLRHLKETFLNLVLEKDFIHLKKLKQIKLMKNIIHF